MQRKLIKQIFQLSQFKAKQYNFFSSNQNSSFKNSNFFRLINEEITKQVPKINEEEPSVPSQDLEEIKRMQKKIQQSINLGNFEEGIQTSINCIEKVKKYYGIHHPATYSSINNLALIFKIVGELESAQQLYEKVLKGYRELFGRNHPSTIIVLQNLANLYKQMKLYDSSLQCFEEVLAYKDLQEDKNEADIAVCTAQMAGCLRELKRYDDSIKILEKSLNILLEKYGESNLITANCQNNLGLTYKRSGKFNKSEVLYLKALKTRESMLPKDHPDIIAVKHNLAELYMEMQEKEKAEEFLVETMESIKRVEQLQQQNQK